MVVLDRDPRSSLCMAIPAVVENHTAWPYNNDDNIASPTTPTLKHAAVSKRCPMATRPFGNGWGATPANQPPLGRNR